MPKLNESPVCGLDSSVGRWMYIDWIPTRPGPVKWLKTRLPEPHGHELALNAVAQAGGLAVEDVGRQQL